MYLDDVMSPFATAYRHQVHGTPRLGLDHDALLVHPPPLVSSSDDPSDPSSPSRRHDIASISLQMNHMHSSLYAPSQCHSSDIPSSMSGRGRTRMPNWSEFYKNGIPDEVIVIEDTPEPQHAVPSNPPSNGAAHSHFPPETQLSSVVTRKRKYQDEVAAKGPERKSEEPPACHHQEKAKAMTVATAAAAAAALRTANLEMRQVGSKTKTVDPSSASAQKRRRTRLQLSNESTRERRLSGAVNAGYGGLAGPVVRSKDVVIRTGHAGYDIDKPKLDDDDGHYVVVPDTILASQYQIKKLLGQGTFGKVVQAVDGLRNELVAIKVIRSVQKYRDAAKIELRVLQTLRQNDAENRYRCIHLRDCFDFFGHTCIVMDLLDSSLFDFLKANSFVPFPNSHIQSFARQLLTSVAFLHDLGLIHTDLKPENILLRNAAYQTFTYNRTVPSSRNAASRQAAQRKVLLNSDIRLIDFGSATFQDEYHSTVVSTRHYRAPEIILGLGWSYPCDIWSIACILVEFFTGDALFQTHDNLEHLAMMELVLDARIDIDMVRQVNRINTKGNGAASYFKRLKLNYPTPINSRASRSYVKSMKRLDEIIPRGNSFLNNFLDLLGKMFVYDPARRITAKQALLHPWFQEPLRDDGTEAAKIAMERERAQLARPNARN